MTAKKQNITIDFSPVRLDERLEQSQQQAIACSRDFAMIYRRERERRRSLEETNLKLRAILNSISDAMVSTSDTLCVEDYNIAFKQMLAAKTDRLKGRHLADVIDLGPYLEALGKFAGNGRKNFDFDLTVENNGVSHYSTRVSKIATQEDANTGFVFVFRNMTEAKRLERLKERLFVFASNEIRTPLNGLTGFLSYLYEDFGDKLAEEELAHFRFLIESGQNLENIVEDLMKLSPLNQSSEPQSKPVSVANALERTLASVEADIQSQDVRVEVLATAQATLFVDEILLLKSFESILCNLIYCVRPGDGISIVIAEDCDKLKTTFACDTPLDRFSDLAQKLHGPGDPQDTIGAQRIGITLARDIIEWNGGKIKTAEGEGFSLVVSFSDWMRGDRTCQDESARRLAGDGTSPEENPDR